MSCCSGAYAGKTGMQKGVFSMGLDTHVVPMSMHADNRSRLLARLRALPEVPRNSFVLLQGGEQMHLYDSDAEILFQQEAYFMYLFGVREAGCYGAIHIGTGQSTLFVPKYPESFAMWMGEIHSPATIQEKYLVDQVVYVDELCATLTAADPAVLYVLHGLNTDSGSYTKPATFPGIERFRVDNGLLHPELAECRVFKSPAELDLLRYVNRISSQAHMAVMKAIRPGMMEYQMESLFLHETYSKGGSRFQAYTSICCAGHSGATLHYGSQASPNDRVIGPNDMCLFDMGGEYHGYIADITCSFPASGRFSPDQRLIYGAVLAANKAVQAAMRPGVCWVDMHVLAARVLAEHLLQIGILHNGTVDEIMAANVPYVFFPHGLGHFMGCNVHDVGGYPKGVERPKGPGVCKLRTPRVLQAGMVITVEPGCYFIDFQIDSALADPEKARFMNRAVIDRFRGFGGVRIEDDIIVTETGSENMTTVPREIEDIERFMQRD